MKISLLLFLVAPLACFGSQTENADGSRKSKNGNQGLVLSDNEIDYEAVNDKSSSQMRGEDSSDSEEYEYGGVVFGPCAAAELQDLLIECGSIQVPLNYGQPRRKKIQLAVSRIGHADTQDYRGIMLVNPGGPGSPGLISAAMAYFIDPAVAAKYDWIGWDPRGIGESIPSFSCKGGDGMRPPYTVEYMDEWVNRGKVVAKECFEDQMDLMPHMSTVNDARDMDRIREALGAEILNFYGFSYGTAIGQAYANLYPEKVGKFVLDSIIDYNGGWYDRALNQVPEVEVVFDKWFDWTAQFDSVYGLGSDGVQVRETFVAAGRALIDNPIGGYIGPAEWFDFFSSFVSSHSTWPAVTQLLSDWLYTKNETQWIEAIPVASEGTNGISVGAYLSIVCTESANRGWPEYTDAITDFASAFEAGATLSAYLIAYQYLPCYWWVTDPAPLVTVDRNYKNEILFISLEFDTRTPLSGALNVRDNFRNSVLVNVPGAVGHAESILAGQSCLEIIVAEYLDSGILPPRNPARGVADYDCVGSPLPDPLAKGRRNAAASQDSDELEHLKEMLTRLLQSSNKIGL